MSSGIVIGSIVLSSNVLCFIVGILVGRAIWKRPTREW